MTVTTSNNSVVYQGNGAAVTFAYNFKILDADDLVVQRRVAATSEIEATYASGSLTITGIGTNSGSVTIAGAALSSDYEVVIFRQVSLTQDLDIVNEGGFYPESVEDQLDRTVMGLQQVAEVTTRALTVARGEAPGEIPSADVRANKALFFDSDGLPTALSVDDFSAPASSAATRAETAASRAEALALLDGYYATVAAGAAATVAPHTFISDEDGVLALYDEAGNLLVNGLGNDGFVLAEAYGAVGNGTTDDSAAIIAALTNGDTRLRSGVTYAVARPVLIPSGRSLYLNGATIKMLASFATVDSINACVGANNKTDVAVYGPGTLDANEVGLGGGDATRKNGVMFRYCTRFKAAHFITIQNCTGYGAFGALSTRGEFAWLTVRNCEILYEQLGCEDISIHDCRCEDGAGTIACSVWLHPVFGDGAPCKRISYERVYGSGTTSGLVTIQGSSLADAQEDISFVDVKLETVSAGAGLTILGVNGHKNVSTKRCTFKCGGEALNMALLDGGDFEDTVFDGVITGVTYLSSTAVFRDCTIIVTSNNIGVTANGYANADNSQVSRIEVFGGEIDLSSTPGPQSPIAGTYCFMSRETEIVGLSANGVRDIALATIYAPHAYDQNKTLDLSFDSTGQEVILQSDAAMQLPDGTRIYIRAGSSGTKTITADTGVTLKPTSGTSSLATIKANGTALIQKAPADDTWFVSGDLV